MVLRSSSAVLETKPASWGGFVVRSIVRPFCAHLHLASCSKPSSCQFKNAPGHTICVQIKKRRKSRLLLHDILMACVGIRAPRVLTEWVHLRGRDTFLSGPNETSTDRHFLCQCQPLHIVRRDFFQFAIRRLLSKSATRVPGL